ncbi:MAG: hypothetical protein IPO16_14685 [Saprospiraceae bacterium]|nr:hypothetical protein [Saprospiraceae bacterium]
MTIDQYLDKLNSRYKTGISTEHSYRGDLQHYLETLLPDTFITNEPSRIACGAPDYILTRNGIPIGYIDGNNQVDKIKYQDNKVWINETQFFDKVPQVSWEFYIGGYQPAQKWLKYRKGRILTYEDILHYQKIIVALSETDRIMKEIDLINFD